METAHYEMLFICISISCTRLLYTKPPTQNDNNDDGDAERRCCAQGLCTNKLQYYQSASRHPRHLASVPRKQQRQRRQGSTNYTYTALCRVYSRCCMRREIQTKCAFIIWYPQPNQPPRFISGISVVWLVSTPFQFAVARICCVCCFFGTTSFFCVRLWIHLQ